MKLLLQLTCICLFVSSGMMAQQIKNPNNSTNKTIERKVPKVSKNNAVVRINEVPARRSIVSRSSNRNTARKQRIVETGNSSNRKTTKIVSHREMIAKRKKIVENY